MGNIFDRPNNTELYNIFKLQLNLSQKAWDVEEETMALHVRKLREAYNFRMQRGSTIAKLLVAFIRRNEKEIFTQNGKILFVLVFA